MKTSWHAFISGYICCRIYMITIEKHIDFLYFYFFFSYTYISTNFFTQPSRYLLSMSEWSHTDVREKAKMVYIQVKLRTRVNDLAEWQSNGLDMIISSIDIDQRQGACLVEGKHLKAFKPFKFHFKRFISWKDWLS